uniref:Uncharacterized protein n=1 Tax=Pseudo-nitzschia delicatissima TaxID=44447 RepID=A0A7S0UP24_9STRA
MDGIVSSSKASSNDAMVLVGSSNSSGNNNRASRRKALWKKRQKRKCGRKQGGRIGGRRNRRLWQLPESSILDYTKWIQEKPEEDRTASEERFLWKCMIRSLGVVGGNHQQGKRGRQERIREFVDRLEAKEPMELTTQEEHFVHLYRKRKQDRKHQKQQQRKQERKQQKQEETTVSWMRNDETTNNNNKNSHQKSNRKNKKKNKGGFEPQASLESLRESMKNMGLSSDKLKQVRFSESSMN